MVEGTEMLLPAHPPAFPSAGHRAWDSGQGPGADSAATASRAQRSGASGGFLASSAKEAPNSAFLGLQGALGVALIMSSPPLPMSLIWPLFWGMRVWGLQVRPLRGRRLAHWKDSGPFLGASGTEKSGMKRGHQ
jgi:hypothetical protein